MRGRYPQIFLTQRNNATDAWRNLQLNEALFQSKRTLEPVMFSSGNAGGMKAL